MEDTRHQHFTWNTLHDHVTKHVGNATHATLQKVQQQSMDICQLRKTIFNHGIHYVWI